MSKPAEKNIKINYDDETMEFIDISSDSEAAEFRKKVVIPYFKDIFKSLSESCKDQEKNVDKVTFLQYTNLPGVLGDRIYAILDEDEDGLLDVKEFIGGLFKIYFSSFEVKCQFVFDIYDFDGDGEISREDARIILSYIPQVSQTIKELERSFEPEDKIRKKMFENRISAQEQIEELCDAVFKEGGENITRDLKSFMAIVEKDCSDLLVSILTVIRDCLPCTDTFWENMHEYYKQKDGTDFSKTGVPSPKFLKQFSPRGDKSSSKSMLGAAATNNKLGRASPDAFSEFDIEDNIDEIAQGFAKEDEKRKKREERMNEPGSPQVHGDAIRLANKTVFGKGGSSMLRAAATKTGEERKERFSSPSRILSGDHEDEKDADEDVVTHSGIMHRESGERKLKGYYYRLKNKDLYYYKKESDEKYKGMYALTNVFLREEDPEPYDDENYVYSFTLIFVSKERKFYCLKKDKYAEWIAKLKQAIGYYSITTYYDIKDTIGKGKFGRVKLAIHKKTDKKVAVKILKKKKMDAEDFELYKREVEILKICQHPNIIRLLDVFENSDYIYIVMEYLSGGPLLQYFKGRKYKLKESRVRDIAHQIAASLFYLKSFGIAHRDMKPDNIIMATDNNDSEIKLIDFGLSKIIGPKERSKDPFGTIPYAAPEIILRKPYSHSVDIWSLGVTVFFLLTGFHPFDSHDQQELLKKIVRQDPDWDADEWAGVSDSAKELVKKLLTKDKEQRIEIKEVLEHEWITEGNEKLRLMRRNSGFYLERLQNFSITKADDEEQKDN